MSGLERYREKEIVETILRAIDYIEEPVTVEEVEQYRRSINSCIRGVIRGMCMTEEEMEGVVTPEKWAW